MEDYGQWGMTPIPVPAEVKATRPELRKISVGPPPGISDEECGTVEALVSQEPDRIMFADYWRPTPTQMAALAKGGCIELIQHAPQMVMHSMTVWPIEAERDGDVLDWITEWRIQQQQVVELRDQLLLASDGAAMSPQQQGSIYALQHVVQKLNEILGPPEIPVDDTVPVEEATVTGAQTLTSVCGHHCVVYPSLDTRIEQHCACGECHAGEAPPNRITKVRGG